MSSSRPAIELQQRDRVILDVLTHRVRALTIAQVARRWWPRAGDPERTARKRLRTLEAAGLVECDSVLAHPELPLRRLLASWQPGQDAPDFTLLAAALKDRWPEDDVNTPYVVATVEAGRLFAGTGGRHPSNSEAYHDFHLSAVYFQMLDELPTRVGSWTLETDLPKGQGIKIPDAMVRDGIYNTAIEFGGRYKQDKLRAFHDYCTAQGYGYEIW